MKQNLSTRDHRVLGEAASLPRSVIQRYTEVARPIMLRWMGRRSCIAATRLTCLVLEAYSVPVEAVPFVWMVSIPDRNLMYLSGLRGAEKAKAIRTVADWKEVGDGTGWDGHVAAIAQGRYLIDAAFDQVSLDGLCVDPMVFAMDLGTKGLPAGNMLRAGCESDDGVKFVVEYRPLDDWTFRSTEAWTDEGLPFIAEGICLAMGGSIIK